MHHRFSFKHNDKALGEHVQDGMEVPHGRADLVAEGRWRICVLVKPSIKDRGEDDEYT
jgi:hypothetical protein